MFIAYFSIFSILIILIFSLILFFKHSETKTQNRFLAIGFGALGVYNLMELYYFIAVERLSYVMLKYYLPVDTVLALLMGPSVYFFIRSVMGHSLSFSTWKTWIHGLPIVPVIICCYFYASVPEHARIQFSISNFTNLCTTGYVINTILNIQLISYLAYCYLLIDRQYDASARYYLDIKKIKPYLLLYLILLLVSFPVSIEFGNNHAKVMVVLILSDIMVLSFLVRMIMSTSLFSKTGNIVKSEPESLKYMGVNLDDRTKNAYLDAIQEVMETRRIYLSMDCTLEHLASITNIPRHHISFVINNEMQKNFAEYINEYRVLHACKLLTDEQKKNYTIEAIAMESGFKSHANFYRVFKKYKGITPFEFRRNQLPDAKDGENTMVDPGDN